MGKIAVLSLFVAATVVVSGCSSRSSGGGGGKNHGFTATDQLNGKLSPEPQSVQHSLEAERQLQMWQSECRGVDGYQIPNLRTGMRFQSREDDVSLWPDLKPNGDARIFDHIVESIVSPKEFFSLHDQIASGYSIKMRSRHTAGVGHYESEMVTIISTEPPELKNQIEQDRGMIDDNYVNCRSQIVDNSSRRAVAFATLTLQSGATVNGILVVEGSEFTNYTCGLYRRDNSLIREELLSARGTSNRIQFYSKDTVSPFNAQCHDDASLLSIRADRDVSGGNGILSLNKTEVLSF